MMNKLLHTPEGVRDIYNSEMERKMLLEEKLNRLIQNYGFASIQTPTFEFFDIFGNEIGTTPSKELYKFFDREGNTLVLRPDITPSIARAAAKYYMDEKMPLRFSYLGNTFINNSSYQGRLKESTQLGAEFIGDNSVDADAEMIALVIACFLEAGLSEFQITLGHVGFFRAICEAAKINNEMTEEVRDLICSKNYFGAQEIIECANVSEDIRGWFSMLPVLNGSVEVLAKAKDAVKDIPDAIEAIQRLENVYEVLRCYGYENYVSFDLSFLSRYDYYTGIVFDGYTFGSGEAVAKGGRYDELLTHFGKSSPAVGCMILMDQLLLALNRQQISMNITKNRSLIIYKADKRSEAVKTATILRNKGEICSLLLWKEEWEKDDCKSYAEKNQITNLMMME